MLKNAKKLYEKYKKIKITAEDLKKAGKLKNNLGAVATKFELLVRMVKSDRRGEFKISTIDAVPDILPIIGFGDDIGVVAYVISKLGNLISEYEKFEMQKKEEKSENTDWDNLRVVSED